MIPASHNLIPHISELELVHSTKQCFARIPPCGRFIQDFTKSLNNRGTDESSVHERLRYLLDPSSFVYDEANKTLYLNGTPSLAGTLYISHVKDSPDIENDDASQWVFPSWSHPLLGLYAVAMHKGGVDYDDVNARMSPENRAQANEILKMLEAWDNEKQLQASQNTDPYQPSSDWKPGAIDING